VPKSSALCRSSAALAAIIVSAVAAPRLHAQSVITNGNFTSNSATTVYNGATIGTSVSGAYGSSNVTGWGVTSCLTLCNPSLPSNDTFTFLAPISFWSGPGGTFPSGGTAITSDAGISVGAIYQTLSNLKVGDTYLLSFSQATMQGTDGSGAFSAAWNVYFGTGGAALADSTSTATAVGTTMNNPAQGSSAWNTDTIALTATAATETLSFFATSNTGTPPFLLLDGVSLTDQGSASQSAVPEPASLAMLGLGLAGMMFLRRRVA
jgi:hypothetical protein